MSRLDSLRVALAALPAPDEPFTPRSAPFRKTGHNEITYQGVHCGLRIDDLFETFRSGAFGLVERDGDYLDAVMEFDRSLQGPLVVGDITGLDRETCLLLLRYYDRQERFESGLRAVVHRQGLLHAILKRMILLEQEAA